MKGLILFPLTVLVIFLMFSTLGNIEGMTYTEDLNPSSTVITNGTSNVIKIPIGSLTFTITPTQGTMLILVGIISVGVILGIQALGSGVGGYSVEMLTKGAYYLAMWGMLSVFSQPAIAAVPVFGAVLYLVLTIMYTTGVMQSIGGANG